MRPYVCDNGIPSGDDAPADNITKCQSCANGYVLTAAETCNYAYVCEHGTPVDDTDATADNITRCAKCNSGFELQNEQCVDTTGELSCVQKLTGPSDATHDGTFLCGAYSQVTVPLSNESMYIIYTNLSANNTLVTLSAPSNVAEYMLPCPYSALAGASATSLSACESPPNGQQWFIMPLESGIHTLSLLNNANRDGGTYQLAVREYNGTSSRLPLNQTIALEDDDPYHFWIHFPPLQQLETRVTQYSSPCGISHTLLVSRNTASNFYTNTDLNWILLGAARYSAHAFGIVTIDDSSGGRGTGCHVQIRLSDISAGEATQVRNPTNFTAFTDFGVSEGTPFGLAAISSTLFMVGQDTDALYKVHTTDGTATQVGNATDFSVSEGNPTGLAAINGTLYMVGQDTDALYRLNTTTGSATQVGSETTFGSVNERIPTGLAAINGTLYMVGQTNAALYKVNTTTGVAIRVGNTNQFGVMENEPTGLAAIGNTLYMVGQKTDNLYTVNTSNGVATQVQVAQASEDDFVRRFGINEGNPTGLAAIGNTLYVVGAHNDDLYILSYQ